ncbi:MAG: tRNA (adenosine(37)-N6)-dimethylallyltransferase MiaA [Rhodospirillaceae bacterium]
MPAAADPLATFADHAAARPGAVLVIGGPTASGKSGLALALARRAGGVVINADSMQVYRDLSVLTARPGAEALATVPHRLYGVLGAGEVCSVARWLGLALAEIATAHRTGALPVLVGGTGLYLGALTGGLSALPEIPPAIRALARQRLERDGAAALHADLGRRDPATAARLPPGDRQRIVRAWEVLEATGRPLSSWQNENRGAPPPGLSLSTIVLDPPRPDLYRSCDLRFDAMMAAGALAEVQALNALGLEPDRPALKALGVPELRRHLAGDLSLDAAAALARQSTRRYAKRQVTWFRHQVIGRTEPVLVIDRLWRG